MQIILKISGKIIVSLLYQIPFSWEVSLNVNKKYDPV